MLPSEKEAIIGALTSNEIKLPASAPISVGVKLVLVCPSKSSVIAGIAAPEASMGVAKVGLICKSPNVAEPVALTN